MCDVLDVPRSTYYKLLDKTLSNRDQKNQKLTEKIIKIYNDNKHRYGAPKIYRLLIKEGYKLSLKRVQRLMRKLILSLPL